MQIEIKINQVTNLAVDFTQIEFSLLNKAAAKQLDQAGMLRLVSKPHDLELPLLFFNAQQQQGQCLVDVKDALFLTSDIYHAEIVSILPDMPTFSTKPIILAKKNGFASAIFCAKKWARLRPLVVLESEKNFPFSIKPSQFIIKSMPADVMASVALLEDWQIVSRLCSHQKLPGIFHGTALQLVEDYLKKEQLTCFTQYYFGMP